MIRGHGVQRAFPTKRAAVMYLEHIVLSAAGVRFEDAAKTLDEAFDAYIASRELDG